MFHESRRFIGAYEIKPGAVIPQHSSLTRSPIAITSVCDAVDPDRWHAELKLFGLPVLTTGQFGDPDQAARDAEAIFKNRVVNLLAIQKPS